MNEPVSVVITGAANGIGRATAARLLEADNTTVVGVDRDADALAVAAAELGGPFIALEGDVGLWATHVAAADAAEQVAPLAGWVNNAGVDVAGAAHEVTRDEIDDGVRLVQTSAMYGTAIAVRSMLPRRSGSIVNVASIQGLAAFPRYFVYGAAKAAIAALARSVAVDYGPFGIRCNTISPGAIDTPMLRADTSAPLDELLGAAAALAPLGRAGAADEIAEVVAFLLSERSSFVTGAEIVVDGGATARCYPYPPLTP